MSVIQPQDKLNSRRGFILGCFNCAKLGIQADLAGVRLPDYGTSYDDRDVTGAIGGMGSVVIHIYLEHLRWLEVISWPTHI